MYYPSEGTLLYSDSARYAQIEAEYLPSVPIAKAGTPKSGWRQ